MRFNITNATACPPKRPKEGRKDLAPLQGKETYTMTDVKFLRLVKENVLQYASSRFDPADVAQLTEDDIYIVWYCKSLQNWKALASTTLPDGMYYELTLNGDRNELYLDAYKKFENRRIELGPDIDPQANRNSREPGKFMPEDNSGKGESPDKSAVSDRKAAVNRSGWYGKMYINNPVEMAYKIILLLEKERTPRVCVDEILETVKSILEFQEVTHTPGDVESSSFPK